MSWYRCLQTNITSLRSSLVKHFVTIFLVSVSVGALAAASEPDDTAASVTAARSLALAGNDAPLAKVGSGNTAIERRHGVPDSHRSTVLQGIGKAQSTLAASAASCQERQGLGLHSATSSASGTDCDDFPHCHGPLGSCCVVLATVPNLGRIWACFITNDQGIPLFAVAGGICAP